MRWNELHRIYTQAVKAWLYDGMATHGAALAFYGLLSLGPLLLIGVSMAGLVFGDEAAAGRISADMRGLIGREGAEAVQDILARSRSPQAGFWATVIGGVTLLFAASVVIGHLHDALNVIWGVETRRGFKPLLRKRLLALAMVLAVGFVMLTSLLVSAGISAFGDYWTAVPPLVVELLNFMGFMVIAALLFALIYKFLPAIRIRWRDVWIGAAMTSVLFSFGKALIGLYLGQAALASTFGAAGSLMAVLIWIYYSAQIFLLGAEFTKVYARRAAHKEDGQQKNIELKDDSW